MYTHTQIIEVCIKSNDVTVIIAHLLRPSPCHFALLNAPAERPSMLGTWDHEPRCKHEPLTSELHAKTSLATLLKYHLKERHLCWKMENGSLADSGQLQETVLHSMHTRTPVNSSPPRTPLATMTTSNDQAHPPQKKTTTKEACHMVCRKCPPHLVFP